MSKFTNIGAPDIGQSKHTDGRLVPGYDESSIEIPNCA